MVLIRGFSAFFGRILSRNFLIFSPSPLEWGRSSLYIGYRGLRVTQAGPPRRRHVSLLRRHLTRSWHASLGMAVNDYLVPKLRKRKSPFFCFAIFLFGQFRSSFVSFQAITSRTLVRIRRAACQTEAFFELHATMRVWRAFEPWTSSEVLEPWVLNCVF